MSLDASSILTKVTDHAARLGIFERVAGHEPKNAPGNGISCAAWFQNVTGIRSSGLSATTARVEFQVRVYQNFISEPQDAIDPVVVGAVDQLINAYSGDFEFGDTIRNVDLLGNYGVGLSAQAGYINMDGKLYRVVDITLPLIVNDVWEQVP